MEDPTLIAALEDLSAALAFTDLCAKDPDDADATGATRDAREWVNRAARDVAQAYAKIKPIDGSAKG